jgi:hypothetical protein
MKHHTVYQSVLDKKKNIESKFKANMNNEATHSAQKLSRATANRDIRYSVSLD